ncbi:hypothetical protein DdX_05800 [Ditylenchus destructor]|uniref:G-protein coupled receptors family 1 profile domain-containing protein n=1 Tax=Ditylenchus destructor TaxID=166010 RepID=A0AAD4NBB7_9BILA|nr:hypothetical protein DdX_05800 [Ditylenchus destructor]
MPIETNLVEIANYVGNLGPLFIISRFLWRCYKSQRALSTLRFSATISNTLLGYIIWWEITFLSTVPRHVYVFFNVFIKRDPFSDTKILLNGPALFWTGFLPMQLIPIVSLSIFFLTVDRIIVIQYPLFFRSHRRKRMFNIVMMTTIISSLCLISWDSLTELPIPETTYCMTTSCLFKKTGQRAYIYSKAVFGLLNFIAGIVFIVVYRRHHIITRNCQSDSGPSKNFLTQEKRITLFQRKISFAAMLLILTEFFVNFMPQFIAIFLQKVFGISISSNFPYYNTLFIVLDIMISLCVYHKTLNKHFNGF